jgi:hypothetical protein
MWAPVAAPSAIYNGPCFERGGYLLVSIVSDNSATWQLMVGPRHETLPGSMHQLSFVDAREACHWADGQVAALTGK